MLDDLHPLTSFRRNSISKSSVKFVGNARRTFVLPSIFAFAFTNDVEMELLPLPLGEGRGEGLRSVRRLALCCSLLSLTPTLSQREREQEDHVLPGVIQKVT